MKNMQNETEIRKHTENIQKYEKYAYIQSARQWNANVDIKLTVAYYTNTWDSCCLLIVCWYQSYDEINYKLLLVMYVQVTCTKQSKRGT